MRVRMHTTYAGPGGACDAGKTIDLPESEAKALVAAGYASELAAGGEPVTGRRGRPPGSRTRKPAAEDPPAPPAPPADPAETPPAS